MKNEKFINQLKNSFPSKLKTVSEEGAKNSLIYGLKCNKIEGNQSIKGSIFLSVSEENSICFANTKYDIIESINIQNIDKISFNVKEKDLIGYKRNNKSEAFFEIIINQNYYIFCVEDFNKLLLLIKGLLLAFNDNDEINSDKDNIFIYKRSSDVENEINKIINKYDMNYDKIFDHIEFKKFCEHSGILPSLLMINIDKNKDGLITKEELKNYLRTNMCGEIYRDIFNKYSNNKIRLNYKELQLFFDIEQKERISELEAIQIIINFNINIKENSTRKNILHEIEQSYIKNNFNINMEEILLICKKYSLDENILEMNLYDFNGMLNSNLLTLYNHNKFESELDLNHPLTHYLINSTHNTYLTGNQLYGKSHSKMYAYAMLMGYRLVELDCYNGPGDDILITHGYTLNSKIKLVDVLIELKENAFINSPMPVILSIENHLDNYHQKVIAKNIKEILKDLYIVPSDKKPEVIPNLKDLQYKFIIKCEGKRKWFGEIIPIQKIFKEPMDSTNNHSLKNKLKKLILRNDDKNKGNIKSNTENIIRYQNTLKKDLFNIDKNSMNPRVNFGENYIELPKENEDDIDSKDIFEEQNEIKEVDLDLEKCRGLLTCDFNENKLDDLSYYRHIDFCKFRCSQYLSFYNNNKKRENMVKFGQHCMIKVYPISFNSYNFDIIKSWLAGCQCACLNMQKNDDDFLLYNKVFFRQNYNCGYVLKPNKLLYDKYVDDNKEKYYLKFRIYSIFNLVQLMEISKNEIKNENNNLNIVIYSIGNSKDDSFKSVTIKLNGNLYFPFVSNIKDISIPVYDNDFAALMIKIAYNGNVIGKGCILYDFMKEGFRRISIYDNNLCVCENTFIVGRFHRSIKNKYL